MMKPILSIIIAFPLLSCSLNENNIQRKKISENYFAEGQFRDDTCMEGLIKFYDGENTLKEEAFFINCKRNGKSKKWLDSKQFATFHFSDGKLNGEVNVFDSMERKIMNQNYYYGFQVGPSIIYEKNIPRFYKYYTLDGEILLDLDLKHLDTVSFEKGISAFKYLIKDYTSDVIANVKKDSIFYMLIYTPYPPKLNFEYTLVEIDSNYKNEIELFKLSKFKYWTELNLKKDYNQYAIKLTFLNMKGEELIYYKRIKK